MSDPLRQLIVEIVREVVAEQPRPDEMMTVAAAAEFAVEDKSPMVVPHDARVLVSRDHGPLFGAV